MKTPTLCAVALSLALFAGTTTARADVSIQGALSNFDCPNETTEVCDEFEIELHGVHPEDIYGFWGNYNYGMPTMTPLPDGTGILVNYHRVGHSTPVHAIEHFGIHMANFGLITSKTFRWKANGVVVTSGPGAGAWPVPIPVFTVNVQSPENPEGPEIPEVIEAIENELPEDHIWVRRSVILIPGAVALDQLMPDDPIILAATPIEMTFQRLEPTEVLETAEPIEQELGIQTQVIIIETYSDVTTTNPDTGAVEHNPGVMVSRVMNAAVTQTTPCDQRATITQQPQSLSAQVGGTVNLDFDAVVPPGTGEVVYQWAKDGVAIAGEDQTTMNIEGLTLADAGQYTLTITNDCGTVTSAAATVTVTEVPPPPPGCAADIGKQGGRNGSDGILDNNDFVVFIDSFFNGNRRADLGTQGGVPGRDNIYDNNDFVVFIDLFFGGC